MMDDKFLAAPGMVLISENMVHPLYSIRIAFVISSLDDTDTHFLYPHALAICTKSVANPVVG